MVFVLYCYALRVYLSTAIFYIVRITSFFKDSYKENENDWVQEMTIKEVQLYVILITFILIVCLC